LDLNLSVTYSLQTVAIFWGLEAEIVEFIQ